VSSHELAWKHDVVRLRCYCVVACRQFHTNADTWQFVWQYCATILKRTRRHALTSLCARIVHCGQVYHTSTSARRAGGHHLQPPSL
jgi:hypothetical protein